MDFDSQCVQRVREESLPRKVHLISICGTGMAPLALLFKEAGVEVTGSDLQTYPPMGDMLREEGIHVRIGYDPCHIDSDVEVVIIGNAIRKDNPEVKEQLRRGISFFSFPQALSHFFLKGRTPLVIVGTHGKTTCSALLAWALEYSLKNPGFLIGGVPVNFGKNSRLGRGPYFVVEGDEYDSAFFDKQPKFLHYMPQVALFTSLEYDHADIYPTYELLREQFLRFVQLVPKGGSLFVCADYPDAVQVARTALCKTETYGFAEDAHWRAVILQESRDGVLADLYHLRKKVGTIHSPIPGSHNVQNATGVVALCRSLGLPMEVIGSGLRDFQGVRKRQEVAGEIGGVLVINDFAHHPTAVRETIRAIKGKFRGRRLIAVFEPRTNTSRKNIFQKEFVDSFEEADVSISSDAYRSEAIPLTERFSPEKWVHALKQRGKEAYWFPNPEEIRKYLLDHCEAGDVVLVMSSGHFENLSVNLLDAISQRAHDALLLG